MKIAIIMSDLRAGGAEKASSALANYLLNQGHEVFFITFDQEGDPFYFPLHKAMKWMRLDIMNRRDKGILKLRAALSGIRPNCIISFLTDVNLRVILSTLGLGIPLIVADRTNPFVHKAPFLTQRAWPFLYRFADKIMVQTHRVKSFYSSSLQQKITVIPNPIDMNIKTPGSAQKIIVAAGNLYPVKRHDLLIKAFATLAEDFPDWQVKIFGKGHLHKDLEDLIRSLNLKGRVHLMGHSDTPGGWIHEGEVFAFTSRYEGFPNAVLEALAAGFPILSTDCPCGPGEIIEHNVSGILTPNEDLEAFTRELRRLLSDENLRRQLSKNALERAKIFAPEKIYPMWEEVIQEVCLP